jgi:hypothetical protein
MKFIVEWPQGKKSFYGQLQFPDAGNNGLRGA